MDRPDVRKYDTAEGRSVYCIPLRAFDRLIVNVYVVTGGSRPVLVDSGSGMGSSDDDLVHGLDSIARRYGERVRFDDLGAIVITHGHIDHFGGLDFVRSRTRAPIAIHMLDRRVLSHYEERLVMASRGVRRFLETSGVGPERCEQYMGIYLGTKSFFHSVEVKTPFEEGPILDGEMEAYHVPGHCPGQVCLRVDDVLLTADHLLEKISPHLSPEAITQNTGLGHYFESLRKIEGLQGIRVGLGGHQGPMNDVGQRVREIRKLHRWRLGRVLEFCAEPKSIAQISRRIFGPVTSYHVLLALLEAGALVEYLYQRGELVAPNVPELESPPNPAILFRHE